MTRQDVAEHVLQTLGQLASDWEQDQAITPETWLFTDLGLQSLDAVVLGASLQQHYGKPIPYAELLADIGRRPVHDVSVNEWVDFANRYVNGVGTHSSGAR